VTTLIDCGVSRSERFIRVAVVVLPVVYDPESSVMAPSPEPVTLGASNCNEPDGAAGSST